MHLKTGDLVIARTLPRKLGEPKDDVEVRLYANCELEEHVGHFTHGMYLGTYCWFPVWGVKRVSACVLDSATMTFGWCMRDRLKRAK